MDMAVVYYFSHLAWQVIAGYIDSAMHLYRIHQFGHPLRDMQDNQQMGMRTRRRLASTSFGAPCPIFDAQLAHPARLVSQSRSRRSIVGFQVPGQGDVNVPFIWLYRGHK